MSVIQVRCNQMTVKKNSIAKYLLWCISFITGTKPHCQITKQHGWLRLFSGYFSATLWHFGPCAGIVRRCLFSLWPPLALALQLCANESAAFDTRTAAFRQQKQLATVFVSLPCNWDNGKLKGRQGLGCSSPSLGTWQCPSHQHFPSWTREAIW